MKTAVISGGAGGLGRALGAGLIAGGWHVVALDIDITGLTPGPQLTPLAVDLTHGPALRAACAQVIASRPSVDLVIYNAGLSLIAPCAEMSETGHRHLFEVNYFAATAMAQAFIPALRAARGTHLAVSSVAGFAPLIHRTAYAASKHALQGFFTSLAAEEAAFGARVQIAAPSFIATNPGRDQPAPDGTQRPGSARDSIDQMTPEAAAAAILRGLDSGAAFIPVGRTARLAWWISRASPALYARLMRRRIGQGTVPPSSG